MMETQTPLVMRECFTLDSKKARGLGPRTLVVPEHFARKLEAALKVAEGAIRQGERALSYAANRLDAQGTQVQVAGDCAVNAAALQVALRAIEQIRGA